MLPHSLQQQTVVTSLRVKKNDALREDVLPDDVALVGLLLSFLKFGLLLWNFFPVLVEFLRLVKEDLLGLFEIARESI
jgi:hypothetical protein